MYIILYCHFKLSIVCSYKTKHLMFGQGQIIMTVEGQHNNLKRLCGQTHPNIFVLVELFNTKQQAWGNSNM